MKNKTELIDFLRGKGYPKRIKGNDGYEASLYDMQPLFDGEFMAIYSYGGGACCHSLDDIKHFEVIEY